MDYLLIYLLLGCFSGFVAGLFGIGGGMVIVPILIFSFKAQHIHPSIITHLAIGTSLACIIVTSLSAVWAQHKRGAVLWPVVKKMAFGLFAGSIVGAQIAHLIPARQLEIIIGLFALLSVAGSGIGAASAIFGIGGGTFTVPYLTLHGVAMTQAVASASACGLPIALGGAVGFMWTGWHDINLPKEAWGFVHLPAFIGISITSLFLAKLGVKMAHQLPAATLKKLFAGLLVVVGVHFIVG